MVLVGFHRFSVVLSGCRLFSVVLYGCRGFSVVLVGSSRFLVDSQLFSVVLPIGSRRFLMVLVRSQSF